MSPSVEPFNEAKYKALMDGLECSEISIAHIKKSTYDFRIESEFYKKSDLSIQKALENLNSKMLCEFRPVLISDGTHFTPQYVENGELFLSAINVKENHLDFNAGYKYISSEEHNQLCKRVKPRAGDVLLRKVGVGPRYACVIPEDTVEFSIFVSVALIRSSLNPFYLSTLINSKFGQTQLIRLNKGISQPDLHLEDIKRMLIPELSIPFQNAIAGFVVNANKQSADAVAVYNKAEDILNCYLAYNKHQSKSTGIKYYSESVKKYDRLDAEYYQPKYEAIVQKLNTRETVQSLCNLHDKNFAPRDKESYQYIELADVGQSGDITDVDVQAGFDLPTRARRIVKTGQVIVSSVEGSLQSCALITDDYDGALCSTGFYVIDSNCINSETLLVLFKSEPIQALMKQRCSGTILTALSKDELFSMPLPMIDDGIQKEIAAKVQESFALRKQSKQLLEYAKQAVEMAIEQGEDTALEWLNTVIHEQEA